MCLAVPGQILSIDEPESGLRQGEVSFGGIRRVVSLVCTPEAEVGDYVLVHVGFALSRVDEAEAGRMFEGLRKLGELRDIESPGGG